MILATIRPKILLRFFHHFIPAPQIPAVCPIAQKEVASSHMIHSIGQTVGIGALELSDEKPQKNFWPDRRQDHNILGTRGLRTHCSYYESSDLMRLLW